MEDKTICLKVVMGYLDDIYEIFNMLDKKTDDEIIQGFASDKKTLIVYIKNCRILIKGQWKSEQ